MYICICKGITDTQIKKAVEAGASKVCDLKQLLGLCSACGKCGKVTNDMFFKGQKR